MIREKSCGDDIFRRNRPTENDSAVRIGSICQSFKDFALQASGHCCSNSSIGPQTSDYRIDWVHSAGAKK